MKLHIVEELLDVFQLQEDDKFEEGDAESSEEELVLSECAAAGTMGRKTVTPGNSLVISELICA